jgi:hypothetical protein
MSVTNERGVNYRYYNMRISTITRNCNHICSILSEEYKRNLDIIEATQKAYRYSLLQCERQITSDNASRVGLFLYETVDPQVLVFINLINGLLDVQNGIRKGTCQGG